MLQILLYILFVLAAIVLIVVILLQEGRGGGFGEALGSHGRETFGVGSRGINTFTAVTAGVFLCTALLIHIVNQMQSDEGLIPLDGPALEAAPLPGTGTPPAPPTGG